MTLWWRGFAGSRYKLEALYLYYHNANGHQTWQGHDLHWVDKLGCNNYRPISLLSNISEIYEKMMHIPLAGFLNKKKILSNCQFGFRNKHSRNHAYSLTEMIRSALDNDPFTCGVFIDLQKVFDTVEHKVLLSKMNHYGIRDFPF